MYSAFTKSLLFASVLLSGVSAMAEEPENPKTESELAIEASNQRKAESDAKKAEFDAEAAAYESQKAKIEAAQAAALAGLPDTDTTGAKGTVSATGTDYFPTILAHRAIDASATAVADDIANVTNIENYSVFMVSDIDIPAVTAQWRFVNAQLSVVESSVRGVLDAEESDDKLQFRSNESLAAVGTVLTALPQVLGGIADIAAFFKVDIKADAIETSATVQSLDALIAARIVNRTGKKPRSVIVPGFALGAENALTRRVMKLAEDLATLRQRKAALVSAAANTARASEASVATLDAEISELTKKIAAEEDEGSKEKLKQDLANKRFEKENEQRVQKYAKLLSDKEGVSLDTLIEQGDKLIIALTTPDEAKLTPLQKVDLAASIFAAENPAILVTTLSSQGGARQQTTGGIFSSGQVSYLGGAIVTFRLTDLNGSILAAGSFSSAVTKKMEAGTFFPSPAAQQ